MSTLTGIVHRLESMLPSMLVDDSLVFDDVIYTDVYFDLAPDSFSWLTSLTGSLG